MILWIWKMTEPRARAILTTKDSFKLQGKACAPGMSLIPGSSSHHPWQWILSVHQHINQSKHTQTLIPGAQAQILWADNATLCQCSQPPWAKLPGIFLSIPKPSSATWAGFCHLSQFRVTVPCPLLSLAGSELPWLRGQWNIQQWVKDMAVLFRANQHTQGSTAWISEGFQHFTLGF